MHCSVFVLRLLVFVRYQHGLTVGKRGVSNKDIYKYNDGPSPKSLSALLSLLRPLQYQSRFILTFFQGSCLLRLGSQPFCEWPTSSESVLRSTFLSSTITHRPFSPKTTPVLVTYTSSPDKTDAAIEQDGKPVICVLFVRSRAEMLVNSVKPWFSPLGIQASTNLLDQCTLLYYF